MPFSGNTTDYSPYMRLYNASAHAIKDVHPDLKVGGPSSNGGVCCIQTFIDVANNMSAPFDFVSGHIYPIESFAECPDANGGPHWNMDCMIDHVTPISENVSHVWDAHGVPLFVTEYAVAGIEGDAVRKPRLAFEHQFFSENNDLSRQARDRLRVNGTDYVVCSRTSLTAALRPRSSFARSVSLMGSLMCSRTGHSQQSSRNEFQWTRSLNSAGSHTTPRSHHRAGTIACLG